MVHRNNSSKDKIEEKILIDKDAYPKNWDRFLPSHKMRSTRMMKRDFRQVDEWGNGQDFLNALRYDCSSLRALQNDPPDLELNFEGKRIGIELVELIDHPAEAIPDHLTNSRRVDLENRRKTGFWLESDFQTLLTNTIKKKDEHQPIERIATNYDQLWLFVHTSEFSLASIYVVDYLKNYAVNSKLFSRIYLKLDYEPNYSEETHHPLFEIKILPAAL